MPPGRPKREDNRIQLYFKLTPDQFDKLKTSAGDKSVALKAKEIVVNHINNLENK